MSYELWMKVKGVDLTNAKAKMLSKKGMFWRWNNNIDEIETEYRQFLYLLGKFPGEMFVPWTQNLDDLWHEHILDTSKYAADCDSLFGRFIHHNPHLVKGNSEQVDGYRNTLNRRNECFFRWGDLKLESPTAVVKTVTASYTKPKTETKSKTDDTSTTNNATSSSDSGGTDAAAMYIAMSSLSDSPAPAPQPEQHSTSSAPSCGSSPSSGHSSSSHSSSCGSSSSSSSCSSSSSSCSSSSSSCSSSSSSCSSGSSCGSSCGGGGCGGS